MINTNIDPKTNEYIELENKYCAHNYKSHPVVIERAKGVSLWDVNGKKYYDFLAGYSALTQGHGHPKIVEAMTKQAESIYLLSRVFHTPMMGAYGKYMNEVFGYDMMLPSNTGAEGVETALKLARKWGYMKKNIRKDEAIIFGCTGNFHGRTIAAISLSTSDYTRRDFGPFVSKLRTSCPVTGRDIRFGVIEDLENALEQNHQQTAAFICEPVQGEAGIILPPDGYLAKVAELCKRYNVLFMCDEVQTGLGRTGYLLGFEHDKVRPDVVILGKALSGGIYPISAVLSSREIMLCIGRGEHGSTFGGNPIACKVAMVAVRIVIEEQLVQKSKVLGATLLKGLKAINDPVIKEVRGRGLMCAVDLVAGSGSMDAPAEVLCDILRKRGLLTTTTKNDTIRFTPPLVITAEELDDAIKIITEGVRELSQMFTKK